MNQTCPGKTLLRVVGIVMIVFSVLAIILSCVTLFAGGLTTAGMGAIMESDPEAALQLENAMNEAGVTAGDVRTFGAAAIVLGIFALLSSIFQLVLGILGTKNAGRPEKATTLFVLGIISLVFAVIPLFGGFNWQSLFGLVLPILYTVGASMNRRAA